MILGAALDSSDVAVRCRRRRGHRSFWATWAFVAVGLWLLARGLPAETFFVGDPGVKLIAARHALGNPARPLELPLPAIGGQPAPFADPFFEIHGDHSHAVTSELFPLVSAPFIAMFGVRGAYLLPAMGFLTAVAAWAWIGTLLDPRRRGVFTLLAATFGTPWLFYGLEFWEHALALGVAGIATVLFLAPPAGGRSAAHIRRALAGVLFGVSILLRPEAVWYVAAVLTASGSMRPRPRPAAFAAVMIGLSVAGMPLLWYTLAHFGTLRNPHVLGNAGLLAQGYVTTRLQLLRDWFVMPSTANAWCTAPGILLAFVPIPAVSPFAGRRFLLTTCAITTALVLLTAPNDGGGQWGPRYLLFAYAPLTILIADAVESLARRGGAGILVVVLVAAFSLSIQRTSYRELRRAKLTYGRVLAFVREKVTPGSFVITDLWWLDQVAAAATVDRTFLYAPDPQAHAAVLDRLRQAGVRSATIIRSHSESSAEMSASRDACFVEHEAGEIPERTLFALQVQDDCAPVNPRAGL